MKTNINFIVNMHISWYNIKTYIFHRWNLFNAKMTSSSISNLKSNFMMIDNTPHCLRTQTFHWMNVRTDMFIIHLIFPFHCPFILKSEQVSVIVNKHILRWQFIWKYLLILRKILKSITVTLLRVSYYVYHS